jgi:uncharacterized radical SAM superfamily protein
MYNIAHEINANNQQDRKALYISGGSTAMHMIPVKKFNPEISDNKTEREVPQNR